MIVNNFQKLMQLWPIYPKLRVLFLFNITKIFFIYWQLLNQIYKFSFFMKSLKINSFGFLIFLLQIVILATSSICLHMSYMINFEWLLTVYHLFFTCKLLTSIMILYKGEFIIYDQDNYQKVYINLEQSSVKPFLKR